MGDEAATVTSWAERAADRSPRVQRSRARSVEQAAVIVEAAHRLILAGNERFTTQELVKEAGVALQTFYRYFDGKDELLLAVIEDLIASACEVFEKRALEFPDPVARLRSVVDAVAMSMASEDEGGPASRFIASEHARLVKIYPDELALATRPYSDLLALHIREGCEAGLLHSPDPERDAWLMAELIRSVHNQLRFVTLPDPSVADDLWRFCLSALGGSQD